MSETKFTFSSVMPKFKDGSDEVDHLEIWVHTTISGEKHADLYEKAKTVCSLANAAPDLLAALKDARETLLQVCVDQHPDNVCCHHLRAVESAITKAGG